MLLRFIDFIILSEQASDHEYYLSSRGHDFLDHLMSPIVDIDESINEAAKRIDTLNPATRPSTASEVPDLLSHPGIAERDNPVHANRYRQLMEHGKRIKQEIKDSGESIGPMRIKRGVDSYLNSIAGMGHNGGPPLEEDQERTRQAVVDAARQHFADYRKQYHGYGKKENLLGQNAKILKNEYEKENSTGLSLAPFSMHGVEGHTNCAKSTKECRNSCLAYTTGRNAMLSNINPKIAMTQYMIHHPDKFAAILHDNMLKHIDKTADMNNIEMSAKKLNDLHRDYDFIKDSGDPKKIKSAANKLKEAQDSHDYLMNGNKYSAGMRMNVTSDYNVNNLMGGLLNNVKDYANKKGVNLQFRDYTKHAERLDKPLPPWYFLSLSHTGQNVNPYTGKSHSESNDESVGNALNNGHTVASIVRGDATHFYDHKNKRLYPIVDGDEDDMIETRHSRAGHTVHGDGTGSDQETRIPTGVVSALRVKGASDELKKTAGNFENQTTTINHPSRGPMRVVEINRPSGNK